MAENTPLTITENPEELNEDQAALALTAPLVIPETPTVPNYGSFLQERNKVDLDIDKLRGMDFTQAEIAQHLVENRYKYQDQNGDYQNTPDGFYELLKSPDFANGAMSDNEIIASFSNTRDVGNFQQFMEGAATMYTAGGAGYTGAVAGGFAGGIPGAIIGGLTGMLAGDSYRRMMAPELDQPYAEKSGAHVAGEIFGGSLPGLNLPWMVADSTISLGSNFIRNNLRKMPYSTPISNGLSRAERFVTEGMASARNAPLSYGLAETRDIAVASGVGGLTEEIAGGDRGGVNVAGDLLAETGAVLIDPVGRLSRIVSNNIPVLRNMVENFSPDRRLLSAGVRLRKMLEDAGENPDEIIPKLLAGEGIYEGNDYTELLAEAGIDFDNRTAALQTGVPILYLLESIGLETSRKKAGQTTEFIADPVIRERHERAMRSFNQYLADLVEMDTPESLGLFADMRDQNYRSLMNERVTQAFDTYQSTVEKALRGGETLDTKRVLFNTFFGEDGTGGVFGDISAQGRVLKNLIPKDINVPAGALEIPDTEALSAEGLVDVYNRIGKRDSIRGARPKLSYGRDLVSLDKVLKEFDFFVNPEKYAKVDDLPTLPETQLDLPGTTVATPDAADFGPEDVSTGELLNFLDQIDQSKRQALQAGNQPLLELLTEIENGAKNTLSMVSQHRSVTTMGGQFSRYFDNYLAYRDEASNVFSNAFLGEMRTGISPELAGTILFKGMGNPTTLRLQQLDDAANFLLDYDTRNVRVLENANELAVAGGLIEEAVVATPASIPNIRNAQERVLRGLLKEGKYFKRVQVRDAEGNLSMIPDPSNPEELIPEMTVETTEAFNTFITDPVTSDILTNYFPSLKADLEDVAKTRTLFQSLENENGLINEAIAQTDAFTNAFRGIYDNPIKTIQDIIGAPGTRITTRENPIQDLTKIARIAADTGDPDVIQGMLDAVINHGYVYAGGSSPIDPSTGVPAFNIEKFKQYLFDPMLPGRRTSVIDVLSEAGILEDGDAHMSKISRVLAEMNLVQMAVSSRRSGELGEIVAPAITAQIQQRIAEAGIGAFGAGIASNMYGLLVKAGIVGGAGSLIVSALGAGVARDIVARNPQMLMQQLMTEMIKSPKLMADVLDMSRDYTPGSKIPRDTLKRMYTFLQGAALVPAAMEFKEFSTNYYGRSPAQQRQQERTEAGFVQPGTGRPNPRRVQPTIVPAPEPVAQTALPPVPVAQAAPPVAQPAPMAPPAQQVAQAPANTDQRARYAAMFPNDMASGVIRQGIGSLG